ncbi:hypothetical protein [Caballeronia sp. LZ032]|uniref:hypothetical protein n=1 Tax=Caballeronia sp. LZ032 TaxID=3038565 RepID=UPI00285ABCAC|nr:hypothetical protein [Caballeronia sp. LZ032]MDR5879041.1 hypothetical protein [Caballeronia sp. LZ032]
MKAKFLSFFAKPLAVLLLLLCLVAYPFALLREGFDHMRAEHRWCWQGGFLKGIRDCYLELRDHFKA